jgi:hypothetical protein
VCQTQSVLLYKVLISGSSHFCCFLHLFDYVFDSRARRAFLLKTGKSLAGFKPKVNLVSLRGTIGDLRVYDYFLVKSTYGYIHGLAGLQTSLFSAKSFLPLPSVNNNKKDDAITLINYGKFFLSL